MINRIILFTACLLIASGCESFTEIDLPDSQLTGGNVFEDVRTADAALSNVYAQLRDATLVTGLSTGLSNVLGAYSDELDYYGAAGQPTEAFFQNSLLETTPAIQTLWNSTYNLIYQANAVYNGVEASSSIAKGDKGRLLGEALFLRAYLHFYLCNLYGDIPYIRQTDYRVNTSVGRTPLNEVYTFLVEDLMLSQSMLQAADTGPDRSRPNRMVVRAFLARVYLYQENWEAAREAAASVIADTAHYGLTDDLDTMFLKDSRSTLWQLASQNDGENTFEAQTFIFTSGPPSDAALSQGLLDAFEEGDQRLLKWTNEVSDGNTAWRHAYKYKQQGITSSSMEYSILIRIEEMYLIRAEANARLGLLDLAYDDLNAIRSRRSLPSHSGSDAAELITAILKERRVEFFTELGHRWFDLKRLKRFHEELSGTKPGWDQTDVLWPLPESELLLNPALLPQNPGY